MSDVRWSSSGIRHRLVDSTGRGLVPGHGGCWAELRFWAPQTVHLPPTCAVSTFCEGILACTLCSLDCFLLLCSSKHGSSHTGQKSRRQAVSESHRKAPHKFLPAPRPYLSVSIGGCSLVHNFDALRVRVVHLTILMHYV